MQGATVVKHECSDRRITETVEHLIEIYQCQFGNDWQQAFMDTVTIDVAQT